MSDHIDAHNAGALVRRATNEHGINPQSSWHNRNPNFFTPVLTQGSRCGCCSMIAASGCFSSNYAIQTNTTAREFAFQVLVNEVPKLYPGECSKKPDDAGCYGSRPSASFRYIQNYGIGFYEDFPYRHGRTLDQFPLHRPKFTCKQSFVYEEYETNRHLHRNFEIVPVGGGKTITDLLQKHTVTGDLYVYKGFDRYMTGVYRGVRKNKKDLETHHSMVLTGVTETPGGEEIFWCRNSYGPGWGKYGGYCMALRKLFFRYAHAVGIEQMRLETDQETGQEKGQETGQETDQETGQETGQEMDQEMDQEMGQERDPEMGQERDPEMDQERDPERDHEKKWGNVYQRMPKRQKT